MIVINKKIEGKTYTELIKYACLKNNIVMWLFIKKIQKNWKILYYHFKNTF